MADENEWQFLGSDGLSGGEGDDISVNFTGKEKKILQFLSFFEASGSILNQVKIDGNVGNNYAQRRSQNGGADGTFVSRIIFDNIAVNGQTGFMVGDMINISGEEKLMILHSIEKGIAGAGNAPVRNEYVGKFTITIGQLDTIDVHNGGSGNFGTKSSLDVAGVD